MKKTFFKERFYPIFSIVFFFLVSSVIYRFINIPGEICAVLLILADAGRWQRVKTLYDKEENTQNSKKEKTVLWFISDAIQVFLLGWTGAMIVHSGHKYSTLELVIFFFVIALDIARRVAEIVIKARSNDRKAQE